MRVCTCSCVHAYRYSEMVGNKGWTLLESRYIVLDYTGDWVSVRVFVCMGVGVHLSEDVEVE